MQRTARRFHIAAALVALAVLTAIGLLVWQLHSAQTTERALLIRQAQGRAAQLAHAAAGRVVAMVRSADFVLLGARRAYLDGPQDLDGFAASLHGSFPEEGLLLLQLYVAGPDGALRYSSLGTTGRITIADRAHFRAHLGGGDHLHISEPVVSRVSGTHSIHFSRPVLEGARFAGVAVVSISPQRLGEILADHRVVPGDEIGLVNADGVLLAFSRRDGFADLVGRKVAEALPFLGAAAPQSGAYDGAAFSGGEQRLLAWHRVGDTGLAVLAGLDRAQAMAPLDLQFRRTWMMVATLATGLLALAAGVAALLLRMSRQQQAVAASEARFRSLSQLSSDWFWEQDAQFRFTQLVGNLQARSGVAGHTQLGKTRWDMPAFNLTEADWERHRAELEAHLAFRDFEMLRVGADGREHWVSVSGEPVFDERGAFAGYRGVGREITDRKRAGQALHDANERLRLGMITAHMIAMDWDIDRDEIRWSDSPEWLRGPLPASGRYPLWKDQVHPEDREGFLETRNRSVATGAGAMQDYRLVRTDGQVLWLRSHQKVFADRNGKAVRMIVAMLDITSQKAAQERLRLSEARLAAAQRLAQVGSWELDIARNAATWSDEVYRIFEIDRARFGASYDAFLDLVHPEDRAAVDKAYRRSLKTREPYCIVHRLSMADGRIKHVEERCETDFAADGTPLRSCGTVQDITERRLTDQALRQSEATLAGVIATAMDAIITIDERQQIVSFNPAAERILGHRADAMLGRPVADLLPQRLRGLHHEHIVRFGESGETRRSMGVPGEVVGLRGDGAEINLEATIARVQAGERLLFSVMLRDVTERKQIEQRVREQARLLDLIFRHSIDNIVLLDRDFNFLRVSASYARACQRDIAEFPGRNHFDLYPSSFKEEAERARDGKTIYQRAEQPFVFPDHPEWGVTYWDIALAPILGADGDVELLLFTLKDVSERVRSGIALRESAAHLRRLSSRLRGVEERERRAMARELHDRIGQNLSTLNLGLGMLGQQLAAGRFDGADEQLAEMQQTLRAVIGHARDLMSELRPPALEEYGLLASLHDLAADFSRKTRIFARVEGSPLKPRPPDTIEIAMYRIAQEALNNAAKHARATQVRLSLASSDDAIELAISDDGAGFDAARPNRGDPTWGLTTMRERAEEAGIELAIDSAPARGTRVTLRARREA